MSRRPGGSNSESDTPRMGSRETSADDSFGYHDTEIADMDSRSTDIYAVL